MAGKKTTKLENSVEIGLHLSAGASDGNLTSAVYVYDETKNQSVQETLDSIEIPDLTDYATKTFVNEKLINTAAFKNSAEVIENKKLSVFDNTDDPVVLKSYITELLKKISDIDDRVTALEGGTTKYTVKFYDYDGGNLLSTQSVESGKAATAPEDPTREGYTFKGWDKEFTNITANTTVNGTWEEVVTKLELGVEWRNHEKATDPETTDQDIIDTTTKYPYTDDSTVDMMAAVDADYPNAYSDDTDSYSFTDAELEELAAKYYVPSGYTVYHAIAGDNSVIIYPNSSTITMQTWNINQGAYEDDTTSEAYTYTGSKYTFYCIGTTVKYRFIIN